MGVMTATQPMTAEEFLALPEPPKWQRMELVEAELVMHFPTLLHQDATLELAYALRSWTRSAHGRGLAVLSVDVLIDDRNIFGPDVLWYAEAAIPDMHSHRPYAVPHLAVEVRSPSTWRYDIGPKKATYERVGLRELWLVDTAASEVLVYRRSAPGASSFDVALELERADTLTSPMLEGFEVPLGELFPAPG